MSMIIAEARRLPLPWARPLGLAAHCVAVDAADVLRVAGGEADLLALQARVADRRLVERPRKHLEILLEAQRPLAEAPVAADLGRGVVQMRGAPIVAISGRLLGDVGRPLGNRKAVHHQARAGLELALELRRE